MIEGDQLSASVALRLKLIGEDEPVVRACVDGWLFAGGHGRSPYHNDQRGTVCSGDDGQSELFTQHEVVLADGEEREITNLTRIDRHTGTAYFGVVIGEKDCWGKGIARETLRLVLRRAAALRLRKVLLEVASDNPRAIALYQRTGFETEGVLRQHLPRGQGFADVIIMAVFLT